MAYVLSERDRAIAQEVTRLVMQQRQNAPVPSKLNTPGQAPPSYVVKGEVPAADCYTRAECANYNTTEDPDEWHFQVKPASATLPLYKIEYSDDCSTYMYKKVLNPDGSQVEREVFNLKRCALGDYFHGITRDAFGKWIVEFTDETCGPDACDPDSGDSGDDGSGDDGSGDDSGSGDDGSGDDGSGDDGGDDGSGDDGSGDSGDSGSGDSGSGDGTPDCSRVVSDIQWDSESCQLIVTYCTLDEFVEQLADTGGPDALEALETALAAFR